MTNNQPSLTDLKESYQRAHRGLEEAKEALQKAVDTANTTKPQLAQAWLDEHYPNLHATVKDASTNTADFSMAFTINVPLAKYPSEDEKKAQEKINEKLKQYLKRVENEALINKDEPCECQAVGEVINECAIERPKEREHQHHFCIVMAESGAIRYCVICEKSWLLSQTGGYWRSNWQEIGEK